MDTWLSIPHEACGSVKGPDVPTVRTQHMKVKESYFPRPSYHSRPPSLPPLDRGYATLSSQSSSKSSAYQMPSPL
eukprot:32128-Eustigmatos_ZCMA.PRE.1